MMIRTPSIEWIILDDFFYLRLKIITSDSNAIAAVHHFPFLQFFN